METQQERIDRAIKKREFRQNKTEISIDVAWSINNANSFMPEKLRGTKKGFRFIKKWYPEFMGLKREYMIENMPIETIEPQKLTRVDFIEAKKEAPQKQAEQEMATSVLGEEKEKEKETEKANELLEEIQSPKDEPLHYEK